MNVFVMDRSVVRPIKGGLTSNLIGYVGEHGSRTFVIRTHDNISDYTTVSLVIETLDCGEMTRTNMPDGSAMLSLTLSGAMLGRAGKKKCQLMMTDGTKVLKSSQFDAYVEESNEIEESAIDGATLVVINEAITQMIDDAFDDVIDSIPSDYTQMSADVTQLKADLGDLDELETTAKTDLVSAINEAAASGGSGLTAEIKTALMNLVNHLVWDDDDPTGQTYITALYNALYPPAELVSISAVYTQSGAIYESNTLDDLKDDLVVTALMSDQTTRPVTDYTLSGTLTEGTSTITVSYGGKTTTFTVTVSHAAEYTRQVAEAGTFIKSGVYASSYDGTAASIPEDVYSISDVRAGDVIQLATNWNSSNVVGKESRWISTPSKVAPDITAGTFTKVGTSYGLYPVTINQDYEMLYIGIINTSSGGYKQYCTWTRESGF